MPTSNPVADNAAPSSTVRVVGSPGSYGVVALRPIAVGEVLFRVEGVVTNRSSRYSVQIDVERHINLRPGIPLEEMQARHPWRFVDHGCDPSAALDGMEFRALRPIAAGDAVTYNYNTTELDMAAPFNCHCGAERCGGRIGGFAHLTASAQAGLRPWLAHHLRRRLDTELQSALT